MMNLKRLGALSLSVVLALSALSGCKSGNEEGQSSSSSQTDASSSSVTQVEPMDLTGVTDPYLAAAGLAGDTVVATAGGAEITADSLLYIGRGLDYALSMEGSLKLKEISYIHSESYAAGELKHGTISLITENMPVIAVATQKALREKTISNIKEVKARGARVILVCRESDNVDPDAVDLKFGLPEFDDLLMPMIAVVPLQLIAYYTSVLKGNDVDKPRNLAKSVTVE